MTFPDIFKKVGFLTSIPKIFASVHFSTVIFTRVLFRTMGGTLPLERETRGLMRQPTLQTQTLTFFIFERILNSRVNSRYILSFQGNESNM